MLLALGLLPLLLSPALPFCSSVIFPQGQVPSPSLIATCSVERASFRTLCAICYNFSPESVTLFVFNLVNIPWNLSIGKAQADDRANAMKALLCRSPRVVSRENKHHQDVVCDPE